MVRGRPPFVIVHIGVAPFPVPASCSYNDLYKWDEGKRLASVRKHGIDFVGCESIFDDFIVTVEDDRFGYGERVSQRSVCLNAV